MVDPGSAKDSVVGVVVGDSLHVGCVLCESLGLLVGRVGVVRCPFVECVGYFLVVDCLYLDVFETGDVKSKGEGKFGWGKFGWGFGCVCPTVRVWIVYGSLVQMQASGTVWGRQ